MAIFTDSRELSRQARNREFDRIKGWRKGAMAILGYKDDGSLNTWGKITGVTGTRIPQRIIANQLAKGSDAKEVLKSTNDEFIANELARGKFAFDVAKTAITLGAGGGAGGASSAASGVTTGTVTESASSAVGSSAVDSGTSMLKSQAGQNLTDAVKKQGTDAAIDATTNAVENMTKDKTDSEIVDDIDADEDAMTEEEKAEQEQFDNKMNNAKKAQKVMKAVPLIGDVASSGMGWYMSSQNLKKETENKIEEIDDEMYDLQKFNLR